MCRWIRYFLLFNCFLFSTVILLNCRSSSIAVNKSIFSIAVPEENQQTEEKILLGRKLFFDKRLSLTETISCSSCHLPEFAFSDRKMVSEGILGRVTERNSPSILNAGYLKTVMYDAHLPTLEMQVIVPIQEHVEMGMDMLALIKKLRDIPDYQKAAKKIFNRDFDPYVLTRSISAFERSLISMNSNFDQYYYLKNKKALSDSERRGWKLFSERLYCTECHPAPHFTTFMAEKNGSYAIGDKDTGRARVTEKDSDKGSFKIPSLRNVALTFPYMHHGKIKDLDGVIDFYAKRDTMNRISNKIIQPFNITKRERTDLKAFLHSLTDTSYLLNFR
jgi:cytochrome c peroxidase